VTLIVTVPAIKTISNSASYAAGAVAPGDMVTLIADSSSAFGPTTGVPLTSDLVVGNKLPTTLGGVQVFFNGVPAPLIYADATQINTIVPYEIAGATDVDVTVQIERTNHRTLQREGRRRTTCSVHATAAGIGQGAAGQYDILRNYMGRNSADNPATRGGILTLYATGEGKTAGSVMAKSPER
jgi:uncharacterized protein (TIGR03437 family)